MHVLVFHSRKGPLLFNHILEQHYVFFFLFCCVDDHPKELNSLPFFKEHSIESAHRLTLTFL